MWLLAARPRTLPAAVLPVLLGSAVADEAGCFQMLPAVVCGIFALLIQVGTNYANDYFDFKKGADTPERIGPNRAVASGWVTPGTMRNATAGVLVAAFLVGLILIHYGGVWLILIGVLSILFALGYTAGPFPLAYLGLGDLFVLIFFGLVAVPVTAYVQTGGWEPLAFWGGFGLGLLITNLLVVNNYRDAETDRGAGKKTLVVRFGRRFGELQYLLSVAIACAVPALMAALGAPPLVLLASIVPALPGFLAARALGRAESRDDFGKILIATANVFILYGALLSLGLLTGV